MPNTAIAPHTPPNHIHHGLPFLKVICIRPSLPFPIHITAITMVAMRNEMVDACIAEPRQRPNLPYIAPIDAVRQPVPMPDICQSRTFRLMECGVFPFFLKFGVTITSSTPATNKRIAIKRMAENGIRTEPKSPKWSMTRLNSSCPNRGKIVVCNCPSARNRQIVIVTVHRAMMPPV